MSIELTEQQGRALGETTDTPPRVTDPLTNTEYVLIPADVYARLRSIVDGMTRRGGWDEPSMDDYERYRKPT